MKIIYNDIIPFEGFYAINLFGVLFVRGRRVPTDRTIRHESVHTQQMREMLYVFFYAWYVVEWLIKLFVYGFNKNAYYNISFEQEARFWQLKDEIKRKPFGWREYVLKSKINKHGGVFR